MGSRDEQEIDWDTGPEGDQEIKGSPGIVLATEMEKRGG